MNGVLAPATRYRVAVLHGGPSSEHDISVISANGVVVALRKRGHFVVPVWVDRAGRWHFADAQAEVAKPSTTPLAFPAALAAMVALGVDVCFMGFHGTFGEDGRIQAALELAGLRYTGSGPLASALAMDKIIARRVFAGVGLPVAPAVELMSTALGTAAARQEAADHIAAIVGVPCVVKVAAGGSSVGVEIIRAADGLVGALDRLRHLWPTLLAEAFIVGVEMTGGVLEGPSGARALPAVEIAPRGDRFFDYEVKYDPNLVEEIVPARVSPAVEAEVRRVALAAHHALGCSGVSRTDVIADKDGRVWLLETNTLPGLTPASLLPKAALAVDIAYAALLEGIIACAVSDGVADAIAHDVLADAQPVDDLFP